MKIRTRVVSIVLFHLCWLSSIFGQTENCLQNLNHPGFNSILQVSSTDTLKREYILHVPESYDIETPTPLLINMHGFGDCASDYFEAIGNFYELNNLANEENILLAYPQGAYREEKEDTYWEPGDTGATDIEENDVYFIEKLIDDISSVYNVDPERIFACGYSNGGMMAYSLACNKSQLFAAIGIMSGTMLQEECTLENSVPIIKFHGIADEVLPYDGNQWYQSVAEVVSFWLTQNEIQASSLISHNLNGGKIVRDQYTGANQNSCLTLYTVIEEFDKPGEHVWFSDEIEGQSPNEIMWNFFNADCLSLSSTSSTNQEIFQFQPNPFTDFLTIKGESLNGQDFCIYNLLGQSLLKGKLNSDSNSLDLSHLESESVYILKIGNQINKLLKSH